MSKIFLAFKEFDGTIFQCKIDTSYGCFHCDDSSVATILAAAAAATLGAASFSGHGYDRPYCPGPISNIRAYPWLDVVSQT